MENKPPRDALIQVMVEAGCSLTTINEKLASHDHPALTTQEAVSLHLALPESMTASDIASADEPEAKINKGAVLGNNPITGEDFCQLNLAVVGLCSGISKVLKVSDPAAWKKYKAMKNGGSKDAKVKAYRWAFERLLELGYVPTSPE